MRRIRTWSDRGCVGLCGTESGVAAKPGGCRRRTVGPLLSGLKEMKLAAIRCNFSLGIRDHPTAPRSPWQKGHVERLIGSIRREVQIWHAHFMNGTFPGTVIFSPLRLRA
jgi:hypothetical protein